MKACNRGSRDADESTQWTRLTDKLPQPPDENDRRDVVWQAFNGHFAWYDDAATKARYGYMRQHAILYVASAPPYDRPDRRDLLAKAMRDVIAAEGAKGSAAGREAANLPGGDTSDPGP